jgi:hypothetical protein
MLNDLISLAKVMMIFAVVSLTALSSVWLFDEFLFHNGSFYGPCEPEPFDGCE